MLSAKHFTAAEIQQASNTDIAAYLKQQGFSLTSAGNYSLIWQDKSGQITCKTGKRYSCEEHDSLIIQGDFFYWNSKNKYGDAITFIRCLHSIGFQDAVQELLTFRKLNIASISAMNSKTQSAVCFILPPISFYPYEVRDYLFKIRKINFNLLNDLIDEGVILQTMAYRNALFPIYNHAGKIIGANIRGISQQRYHQILGDGSQGYSLFISGKSDSTRTGLRYSKSYDSKDVNHLYVFESVIDMLSFITLDFLGTQTTEPINCLMLAMGGVKYSILENILNTANIKNPIFLCVDNDSAGDSFIHTVSQQNIPYIEKRPNIKYKDWNEQLQKTDPSSYQ